ncbi:hypothetical protein ZIOFF_018238 [Zingiber officinale]|uniref:Glutathione peroxidase n=1 Tax=Zingiber officinale TaxID=94328 RepID=A0A8J5LAT1_ZINOF|nr:hypothetical protein ZIOFF_018238 [Zingiber officinale]
MATETLAFRRHRPLFFADWSCCLPPSTPPCSQNPSKLLDLCFPSSSHLTFSLKHGQGADSDLDLGIPPFHFQPVDQRHMERRSNWTLVFHLHGLGLGKSVELVRAPLGSLHHHLPVLGSRQLSLAQIEQRDCVMAWRRRPGQDESDSDEDAEEVPTPAPEPARASLREQVFHLEEALLLLLPMMMLRRRDYALLLGVGWTFGSDFFTLSHLEHCLEILAFPCNQFAGQEPGSKEIVEFACTCFKAEYPIFERLVVEVNGRNAAPIYKFLKCSKDGIFGDSIKWNFTKFLVDKDGKVIHISQCANHISSEHGSEKDIKELLEVS